MTTNNAELTITRFNTFERDETTVLRLFSGRKLAGEFDEQDARGDYEEALPAFLSAKPRLLPEVLDFLGDEPGDEEDEDEGDRGSIVPPKYRIKYGATQRCGDDVAEVLSAYVTLPRKGKKSDLDGGLDRTKLREVAAANGLGDKLAGYEDRGLNGGLLRMNISNILRGMVRRGEGAVIGKKVWERSSGDREDPKPAKTKTGRTAAAKPAKSTK